MGVEECFYRLDPRKIHVISGDVPAGYWDLHACVLERSGDMLKDANAADVNRLDLDDQIETVELQDINNTSSTSNLIGLGVGALAGLRFFGPLGAIGGALAAQALVGNRHDVTVSVKLKDGRHFVASMDKNLHRRLQAIKSRAASAV